MNCFAECFLRLAMSTLGMPYTCDNFICHLYRWCIGKLFFSENSKLDFRALSTETTETKEYLYQQVSGMSNGHSPSASPQDLYDHTILYCFHYCELTSLN